MVACLLHSRGGIISSLPIAGIAVLLRLLSPKAKVRRFASYDPFFVVYASWGLFVAAPPGHWTDSAVLVERIVAVVLLVASMGWCLFCDWHRFRVSGEIIKAA